MAIPRYQLRRGTAAEWVLINPLLLAGEIGFETDTRQIKVGTGVDRWLDLSYISSVASVEWSAINNTPSVFAPNVSDSGFQNYVSGAISGHANLTAVHGISNTADLAYASSLANVATTGDYSDLLNLPLTFPPESHNHTAAAITDFASAVSSNAPVQNVNGLTGGITLAGGDGVTIASSGSTITLNATADLTGYATESFVTSAVANLVDSSPAALDTLAELAQAIGDDANFSTTITNSLAGKANLSHSHDIADVTGLQSALDDKADASSLATVATSGNYADLSGIPSEFTPAAHNHASTEITDFAASAAANAPIQGVNNLTGNITIANGTGLTLTESGSTLTLAAALPPSNLADLADVSGTPTTNQALIYTGSDWQPGDIPAGTTLNGLSGAVVLANGTGITLTESGQTLTLASTGSASGGDVDGGLYAAASNVLTEVGDILAAESGDTLAPEGDGAVDGDTIQLLRSSMAGAAPSSLLAGELAINTEDGLLYWARANGTIASADIDLTLANVATSGSYNDLSDLPTLGTAAATNSTDYATAAQGALADSAVQPGDLATVATSGLYSDLASIPSEFTPATHTHTSSEITDFGTAAAASAPLQSLNSLTGTLTIAGSGGTTVTEAGSTITVASTAPPTNIADLSDVSSSSPSTGEVLAWNGTAWEPAADATGGGGGYGSLLLFG